MNAEPVVAATRLADRFWAELLAIDPVLGTYVGDETYDDRLPDPSEEGLARRQRLYDGSTADLAAIDRAALPEDLRTTLDVLETGCRRGLNELRWRFDRFWSVSHLFGPGNLLGTIASVQRADTAERVERYVARLRAFPVFLEAVGSVALEAAQVGQTMPALVVERSIQQVDRLLRSAPEASPGLTPVESRPQADRDRVVAALREAVWPAYARYLEVLREYRPHARPGLALGSMPDGEAMYAAMVSGYTSLELDARRIHEIGMEELAAIQEERQAIARGLGFPTAEEAIAAHDASGRNRATTREELLEVVRDQVQRSWEAAPHFFGRLPKENCIVKPVEEYREDDMPGAYYNVPTADGSRPGIYYVNTGQLDQRALHQTATTSFHEANPGHHFQLAIEQEFSERHPLRRFGGDLVGDAFVEGWGLYSERLADEMGLFLDDYERLGMLEQQAFRAGRLIVDTGIHALGWDRDRAVQTMMATGTPGGDCEIEVDRYIADPGQALAYMLGRLQIDRWRAASSAREGESSLSSFHDRLLSLGSLPLPAIERELLA